MTRRILYHLNNYNTLLGNVCFLHEVCVRASVASTLSRVNRFSARCCVLTESIGLGEQTRYNLKALEYNLAECSMKGECISDKLPGNKDAVSQLITQTSCGVQSNRLSIFLLEAVRRQEVDVLEEKCGCDL